MSVVSRGRPSPATTVSTLVTTLGRQLGLTLAFVITVAAVALAVGLATGARTALALQAGAALLGLGVCLLGPRSRLVVTVVGALVVFQSDLNTLKYGYLVIALVCFAYSVGRVLTPDRRLRREFRPLVAGSAVLVLYLLFTSVVAASNGTDAQLWFRDALSYFLLALLPYVGIAAGEDISPRWRNAWFVTIGIVVSIGMTTDWLDRRGVSALPVGRLVLPSTTVVALCFAYAITKTGLPGRNRVRWSAAAGFIFIAVLLTGSRTNLVLLVAFAGITGAARKARVPASTTAGAALGILLVAAVAVPLAAPLFISDPDFLGKRLGYAGTVLTGDAGSDQSFLMRQTAYDMAAEAFGDHVALGTGPGYSYPTETGSTFNLDAPGIVPAKFGLVGIFVVGFYLVSLVVVVTRIRARYGPSPSITAARGWLVVLIALTPFGPWLEEKGFTVAVAMVMAAVISETAGTQPDRGPALSPSK